LTVITRHKESTYEQMKSISGIIKGQKYQNNMHSNQSTRGHNIVIVVFYYRWVAMLRVHSTKHKSAWSLLSSDWRLWNTEIDIVLQNKEVKQLQTQTYIYCILKVDNNKSRLPSFYLVLRICLKSQI